MENKMKPETQFDLMANIQTAARYAPDSISKWGDEKQVRAAIEEMGELISILCRHARGRVTNDDVHEEIADVLISVTTLVEVFGADKCVETMKTKLAKYRSQIDS
jgi:NTP pyrophosphatase (non-canonical NTP hydrolase)